MSLSITGIMIKDVELIAEVAARVLPLSSARLGDEYYYQSLPLCVIDAVYSIAVRYEGVRNVVARYCSRFGLTRVRLSRGTTPPINDQEPITAFCKKAEQIGHDRMADTVFCNRQRTSTRNGILKAEAVFRFADVLRERGIECFQDIPNAASDTAFAKDIHAIPGQSSGISLNYFWMLAGSDDFIKPDRMVLAFIRSALGRSVSSAEAQELLRQVCQLLTVRYPRLTPRLLDHEVWKYQRDHRTLVSS